MMTCRLLCALLVLALCCCPSACVTATAGDPNKGGPGLSPAQSEGAGVSGQANTSRASSLTPPTVALPGPENQDGTGEASVTRIVTGRGTDGVTGTPGFTGNSAKQPHGTPSSQGAGDSANRNGQEQIRESSTSGSAESTKKVQERAPSGATGGKGPSSQPSNGKTQIVKPTSQGSSEGTDVPGSSNTEGPETIPKQGPGESDGSGSSGGSANPAAASSSVTGTVLAQSQKENAPTTTTTTTTKAPTTTTTTTTEAPTTTTTRAPSLLRESDGSLSSSAWVCAPLLLALAALAYTTLG
ncbi:putative mucin TcMUCII [Trypanosoma cruzi]|uniref:Mucin TcMUCII, putative n=2 Tax=Trypanosoma cruzi TaxID=5693 RepID=Q4DGH1_TRYCC|nr:mucin TcMUCII, putative [Trypanosoma cruzi]EAN91623.1 mucin TcMUCII, putative [Trypanosoma cruzi]PWV14689.1 putative mucin TcMUCII [Trypanosoma cruzi]|eukprot:XP_813474.1 mucin TcMUCII [Trypanosoma cruzi strain CL Brener]